MVYVSFGGVYAVGISHVLGIRQQGFDYRSKFWGSADVAHLEHLHTAGLEKVCLTWSNWFLLGLHVCITGGALPKMGNGTPSIP